MQWSYGSVFLYVLWCSRPPCGLSCRECTTIGLFLSPGEWDSNMKSKKKNISMNYTHFVFKYFKNEPKTLVALSPFFGLFLRERFRAPRVTSKQLSAKVLCNVNFYNYLLSNQTTCRRISFSSIQRSMNFGCQIEI